jgi:hypothetical protein
VLQLKQCCNAHKAINIDGDKVMRETIGSLKTYFIFIAVLGLIGSIGSIAALNVNPIFLIVGLIGLLFSVAYLYIGIRLRKLLVESPKLINNVIFGNMAYMIINFLLTLLNGFQSGPVIQLAVGLLITWYLHKGVERLSQEEKSKAKLQ